MVEVILYQDEDGTCPVLAFLDEEPLVAQQKAFQHIEQLKARGHTARRPLVENLGEGLWELRFHHRRVQYRILYFFHGRAVVVLAHAFTKEGGRAASRQPCGGPHPRPAP
jgi:phage-related protein